MPTTKKAVVKTGTPNPIDIHVGGKVRSRRTLLGMSQEELGRSLGLTFQQVQRYEKGTNRIGASRLFNISQILSVPVAFFFEGLKGKSANIAVPGFAEEGQEAFAGEDPMEKRETLELVRAYYSISDPKLRKRLFEMAKAMADTAD